METHIREPKYIEEEIYDDEPAWSPTGDTIAFSRYEYTDYDECAEDSCDIYTIGIDGADEVALTREGEECLMLRTWHPEGSKLAFTVTIHFFSSPRLFTLNTSETGYRGCVPAAYPKGWT